MSTIKFLLAGANNLLLQSMVMALSLVRLKGWFEPLLLCADVSTHCRESFAFIEILTSLWSGHQTTLSQRFITPSTDVIGDLLEAIVVLSQLVTVFVRDRSMLVALSRIFEVLLVLVDKRCAGMD